MPSEATKLLTHDHAALDEVLNQLQTALDSGDVEGSHAKLDLFWARLAVHIRAEHLHLFPAIINRLRSTADERIFGLTLSKAQAVVERLRADHDFFMHELARAIGILRDLVKVTDRGADEGTRKVRDAVLEIEKRLVIHNELEESQIYRWATTILSEQEQVELANRINAELANRPPRFALRIWSSQ